jgi:DNA-binding NtrC family response regulator
MAGSILLVDDDTSVLKTVGDYFEAAGFEVWREASGEAGLATWRANRPDVVLLALRLPDGDGLAFLEQLHALEAATVVLAEAPDTAKAVRALELGAEHFVVKPADTPHLAAAVNRVLDRVRLLRQNRLLRLRSQGLPPEDLLGQSPAMRELARHIRLLAESGSTTVLLTGEFGTGKGWVARLIHDLSPRRDAPFVDINCGGLHGDVLDSELFGQERGTGPDARERRVGLFEMADRGSLFLDAIGDLAIEVQPRVLKAIENRTIRRAGGMRDLRVDVRLIGATSHDIGEDVRGGRFREDLYYRLNVLPLQLPPLRERAREDRLLLVQRFFSELRGGAHEALEEIGPEALDRLLDYRWPGNVRELRNVMERACFLARGTKRVGVEHLPPELGRRGTDPRTAPMTLAELERRHVERILRKHSGNRTRAAEELGISRATLINKIKAWKLEA